MLFCLTSYIYFLFIVYLQHTFNSIYIIWSCKPRIGNQLMRERVGTYNFSRKVLKPKIFSSEENNFCIVHFLSKIITYLVLMLYYFLSLCLVLFILHKLLFCMLSLHPLENQVMLYFLSMTISGNRPFGTLIQRTFLSSQVKRCAIITYKHAI